MEPDIPPPEPSEILHHRAKVSRAQVESIVARVKAGEKQADICREFGLSRQAVSIMVKRAREREERGQFPTPYQMEQLRRRILETQPADHGLQKLGDALPDVWNTTRAEALSQRMFGHKVPRRRLEGILRIWRREHCPTPPSLDGPDEETIPREFKDDKEFLAWLKSPEARRLREKEKILFGGTAVDGPEGAGMGSPHPAKVPAPGVRTGKHKGSKPNPFTRPKDKKKKKKKHHR